MFQVESTKRPSPSPSRSSVRSDSRASRQPRVIHVNRDVATMVERDTRSDTAAAATAATAAAHTNEWETDWQPSSGPPFRSRTFSDGFLRNTSQELLLGVDCEACRICLHPDHEFMWCTSHANWHQNISQPTDIACSCNLKPCENYLEYSQESHRPPINIYDIETIKRDTGRSNLTAGTHHSLDRKHVKGKSLGVSNYIAKQLVSLEPNSTFVQRLKKNLNNLKKIGGEALSKKQLTMHLNEMPSSSNDSFKKVSRLSLTEKNSRVGYSQSCLFTSENSNFNYVNKNDHQNGLSTYTNFTGNLDHYIKDAQSTFERRAPGKLIKMKSFDQSETQGRGLSTSSGASTKFSTLDGRSSRCRNMSRQMSYNEIAREASFGCEVRRERIGEREEDGPKYVHEFTEPELVILEASPRHSQYRCTCEQGANKQYSMGFFNIQGGKRATPAPDVTARSPASRCAACKASWAPAGTAGTASSHSSTTTANSSRRSVRGRRWCVVAALVLVAGSACVAGPLALRAPPGAPLAERLRLAHRLLHEAPLVDGHNDLPWNIRKFLHNRIKDFKFDEDLRTIPPWASSPWSHTDLPRLKQGRVSAQFWGAYVPCDSQYRDAVQLTFEQIDVIQRLTEKYHPQLTLCTTASDIISAHANHRVCSLVGVEGGHALGSSLGVLRTLYQVGVRYLTLTSTCDTPWAECSSPTPRLDPNSPSGLTPFGKIVIKEMNRLGMLVDLSHVSARTMRDALAVSRAPVMFSHSSARALCNVTRNVPDSILRKLAANKGIVMVNFYASFLTCKNTATVHDAIAHINHIKEVAGVDSVGLGAGFDGINYTPQGLEDVSSYPLLFAELMEAGWTIEELRKLAGLNLLRVLEAAERVSRELTAAQATPYEDAPPKPLDIYNCSSQDS